MRRGFLPPGLSITRDGIWLRPSLVLIALALVALLCCEPQRSAHSDFWFCRPRCCGACWAFGARKWSRTLLRAPGIAALSDGLLRTVEGTIVDAAPVREETVQNVEEPAGEGQSQRIDLRVSSIEVVNDAEDAPASCRRRCAAYGALAAGCSCGGIPLRRAHPSRGSIAPPRGLSRSGAWSRADYLLNQGITSTASVSVERVERLGPRRRSLPIVPNCRVAARRRARACWRCPRPCRDCLPHFG